MKWMMTQVLWRKLQYNESVNVSQVFSENYGGIVCYYGFPQLIMRLMMVILRWDAPWCRSCSRSAWWARWRRWRGCPSGEEARSARSRSRDGHQSGNPTDHIKPNCVSSRTTTGSQQHPLLTQLCNITLFISSHTSKHVTWLSSCPHYPEMLRPASLQAGHLLLLRNGLLGHEHSQAGGTWLRTRRSRPRKHSRTQDVWTHERRHSRITLSLYITGYQLI